MLNTVRSTFKFFHDIGQFHPFIIRQIIQVSHVNYKTSQITNLIQPIVFSHRIIASLRDLQASCLESNGSIYIDVFYRAVCCDRVFSHEGGGHARQATGAVSRQLVDSRTQQELTPLSISINNYRKNKNTRSRLVFNLARTFSSFNPLSSFIGFSVSSCFVASTLFRSVCCYLWE